MPEMFWLIAPACLLAGMATGWFIGRASLADLRLTLNEYKEESRQYRLQIQDEQQQRVEAQTRLRESLGRLSDRQKTIEELERKLNVSFSTISVNALRNNSREFAEQVVQRLVPLNEALQRYETEIRKIEEKRLNAYGSLSSQVSRMTTDQEELKRRTTDLVNALKTPTGKGRWGEITLRRVVEVAGLSPYCDFEEQKSLRTEDGRLSPDMIVRLPGQRIIVVDAKTPLSAYLEAMMTDSEEARRSKIEAHIKAVRSHFKSLSRKEYMAQFEDSPEFVVMFLPGEAFFSAALEGQNRDLIEEALREKVILASPTTLIALLRAVALGWQQQKLLDNARVIADAARELYKRVCVFAGHLGKVGLGLRNAVDSYNKAIASWNTRVRPMENRIAELGVQTTEDPSFDLGGVDVLPFAGPNIVEAVDPKTPESGQ